MSLLPRSRSSLPPAARRRLGVALTVAAVIAVIGFITGTRGTPLRRGYAAAGDRAAIDRPLAPKQGDMERTRYALRRQQHAAALALLAAPSERALVAAPASAEAYDRAVLARTTRRAYDGAPPVIPHAVDQLGAPACVACHERGMSVRGKVAPPFGHASLSSCLQCHVTSAPALPVAELLPHTVAEQSSFVGLASPGRGARAWFGAPPQMPHQSFMRERCIACHGMWSAGLASSHLERQNCLQCHGLSAQGDQMPRSLGPSLLELRLERP